MRIKNLTIFTMLALFFSSCSMGSEGAGSVANGTTSDTSVNLRDDVEGLSAYLLLDDEVDEVVWFINSDNELRAVIRCNPDECASMESNLEASGDLVTISLETEDWFPAELKAQATTNPSGDLKAKAFKPGKLLTEQADGGSFFRIENSDYFIAKISLKRKV